MKRATILATLEKVTTRTEALEGKDYIVAPVILLTEGVHHGTAGPVYYSPDILNAYVDTWNGVPLPILHPVGQDGSPLSANTPSVQEHQNVGRLFNVYYDANGNKIRGEVWIDADKANRVCPDLVSLVRTGGRLEVSTGMYFITDNTPGEWNGEEFIGTVIDMRPDHLALLPDGEGACSWADGCGVRNNTAEKTVGNVKASARTPSFIGTESTSWAGVKKTFSAYRDGYYKAKGNKPENADDIPKNVADAPAAMKTWIASKTLLGESGADNERDLTFFPVVNPSTNKLNEGALRAVIGGRGSQANIPATAKKSAQNKARSMLNKHFDADLEGNMILFAEEKSLLGKLIDNVVKLGKRILRTNEMSHDDVRDAIRNALKEELSDSKTVWVKDLYDGFVVYEVSDISEGFITGPEKIYKRDYSVNKESGVVTFGQEIVEVKEETKYVPVENQSESGDQPTPADNKSVDVKEDVMKIEEMVTKLIANDQSKFTEDDKEWLLTLSECQLGKLEPVEVKVPVVTKPEVNTNTASGSDGGDPPAEPEKPATLEEYIANAPQEVQEVLKRSVARDKNIKEQLVKKLIENKSNTFSEDRLRAMSIDDLVSLNEIAGNAVDANYELSGGGAPVSTNDADDNRPDEPMQVWNLDKTEEEKVPAKV